MDLRPSQGNENRWLCDGAVMARYVVTIVVLSLVFQAQLPALADPRDERDRAASASERSWACLTERCGGKWITNLCNDL